LAAALDEDLRAMMRDQTPVDQAMAKANNRWKQIVRKQTAAQWNADVRASVGLQDTR
jgi:hypothetical protein